MGRTPCCDSNGLKKGPWTPDEDKKLIEYIQKHGQGSWRALPAQAGLLRCGKSCRLRWTNYLRPDIKRGRFSIEEEQTILQLHAMLGNKWSTIAARLPGRTDNEIKNFWNTHLKKRLLQTGIDPVTHGPTTQQHHVSFQQSLANGWNQADEGLSKGFWRLTGAQCLDYNDMLLVADDVSDFMPIHNRDEQHVALINFQPTSFPCNEGGFHYECQKVKALAGFGNDDTKENYAFATPCSHPNLSSYYVSGGIPELKSGMYVESSNPYGESAGVPSDLTYEGVHSIGAVNKNVL